MKTAKGYDTHIVSHHSDRLTALDAMIKETLTAYRYEERQPETNQILMSFGLEKFGLLSGFTPPLQSGKMSTLYLYKNGVFFCAFSIAYYPKLYRSW